MKWLGVVGTREVNDTIRRDIEHFVGQKIADSNGIVSGGATGVDHEAARLAYEWGFGSGTVSDISAGKIGAVLPSIV